jgi:type II secretory pathway pseudopilin PulG
MAFTLTELVVAIAIMVVLMAVGTMSYSAMFGGARTDTAINVIGSALGASRALIERERAFLIGSNDGIALIFTPGGEVRMTENVWYAKDGTKWLEDEGDFSPPLNGYDDIQDAQRFSLPASAGVVAITRDNGLKLLSPPFAVRYDRKGQIIAGNDAQNAVYYDGADYDGNYATSGSTRTSATGEPAEWDPREEAAYRTSGNDKGALLNWSDKSNRMALPFEQLEAVLAVIVYDKYAFKEAGHTLSYSMTVPTTPTDSTAPGWIVNNGTVLFFNRYTGTMIKEQ